VGLDLVLPLPARASERPLQGRTRQWRADQSRVVLRR